MTFSPLDAFPELRWLNIVDISAMIVGEGADASYATLIRQHRARVISFEPARGNPSDRNPAPR